MAWVRCQSIGHGSFAKVSLAKPTNQTSQFPPLMAVKSCPANQSSVLKNEFLILDELKGCPEIVTCYGESFTVENGEKLYNVELEYASGGSLADKVKNSGSFRLSELDVRRYTKSILKGLRFIHRKGFVHCDLKLQNVLVFSGDNVKIADFGLAKRTAQNSIDSIDSVGSIGSIMKWEIRGSPMYMAPETVAAGEQGPAADVWAVGCVVTEMMTGKPPWKCTDIGELLMRIGVGDDIPEIPGELSEMGKDFVRKCFVKDGAKRWTVDMLLNHPFMDGDDGVMSNSPRNPFEFLEWESEELCSVSSFCSPELESECWSGERRGLTERRLRQLVVEEGPDWSVTSSWVSVRCR